MVVETYLNFNGTCAEAFRYYALHLGGSIETIMTFADAPDHSRMAPSWQDRVLHARMSVGGAVLMGADIPDAAPMRSAYLSLSVDTGDEAERAYAALSDGGEVFMAMQETFFATHFAQLRDRFGVNWMIQRAKAMAPGH